MSIKQSILRQEKAKRKHIGETNIHKTGHISSNITNNNIFKS